MDDNKRSIRNSVIWNNHSPLEYHSRCQERKVVLPESFPEKVLEIESWIDKGDYTKEDLEELMLIYSQVVEYYNSINSDKANYYADRIQSTLMKPQILERMSLSVTDPDKLIEMDEEVKTKRMEEKGLNSQDKSQKKAQEYNRKQKERSMQINVHNENKKKEKKQTLERIIEETHKVEDTSVDQVAMDLIKQSTDLHKRLAERRRNKGYINSCKNANLKSFKFESINIGNKLERGNIMNMPNVSIIKKENSDGEEDESFNLEILNKIPDTTTSTLNVTAKATNGIIGHENLRIKTSLDNEEEEEESEDEELENNLIDIWKEWENVFETIQAEKEETTNKFIEDFTIK